MRNVPAPSLPTYRDANTSQTTEKQNNLMERLLVAWRMELRLICWHWSFLLLVIVWTGISMVMAEDYLQRSALGSARTVLEGDTGRFAISLLSLIALFVGGMSASRNTRTCFDAFAHAFPSGFELQLGRWLAVVSALTTLLIIPLGIALMQGPLTSFGIGAPLFVLVALITLAFVTAGVWWLMDWLGLRGRWVYLLLFFGWVGLNIGPLFPNRTGLRIAEAELIMFARAQSSRYQDLWGRLFEGERPLWFNLFYVGLTLLFLGMMWQRTRRRTGQPALLPMLIVGSALMLTTGSAYNYHTHVRDWLEATRPVETPPGYYASEPAMSPERIDSYAIAVDLRAPARPSFAVDMEVRNASDQPLTQLDLTLNRDFHIISASVPFERSGDIIHIKPSEPLAADATLPISLNYTGQLLSVWESWEGFPEAVYFTHPQGVRLATAAGWYPLPGRISLALHLRAVPNFNELPEPSQFEITITYAAPFPIASNLREVSDNTFVGDDATWVYLVGSPQLAIEQEGDVQLLAAQNNIEIARASTPRVQNALEYYRRFFPNVEVQGVTITLLDDNLGIPTGSPPSAQEPIVMYDRQSLAFMLHHSERYNGQIERALLEDLWQLAGGSSQRWSDFGGIAQFLWKHYQTNGEPQTYLYPYGETGADHFSGRMDRFLTEVHEQHGDDGVVRVLNAFAEEQDDVGFLEDEPLHEWVQEVANAP